MASQIAKSRVFRASFWIMSWNGCIYLTILMQIGKCEWNIQSPNKTQVRTHDEGIHDSWSVSGWKLCLFKIKLQPYNVNSFLSDLVAYGFSSKAVLLRILRWCLLTVFSVLSLIGIWFFETGRLALIPLLIDRFLGHHMKLWCCSNKFLISPWLSWMTTIRTVESDHLTATLMFQYLKISNWGVRIQRNTVKVRICNLHHLNVIL